MAGTVKRTIAVIFLCAALGACASTGGRTAADDSTESFVANALRSYGVIPTGPTRPVAAPTVAPQVGS